MLKYNVQTASGTVTLEATCEEAAILQVEDDGQGPVISVSLAEAGHA